MCSLKVIPVAIGSDADSNELEKVTTNRKNLVTSPKDEDPKSLGRKIMSAVIKGDFKVHLCHPVYIISILIVFFSILINYCLEIVLIFVKRNFISITLADERRRYAAEAKSRMSDNNTKRFSFNSYSHVITCIQGIR